MEHEPCKNCSKKGCGSYHDICEEYQSARAVHINEEMARKKHIATDQALKSMQYKRYGRGFALGQR